MYAQSSEFSFTSNIFYKFFTNVRPKITRNAQLWFYENESFLYIQNYME